VNKYLTAATSGLSYAVASFLVTQVLGATAGGVLLLVIGAGALVAGLATLGHASRLERRGLPAVAFASIIIGWSVALIADLVAGTAFIVLLAILLSRAPAGF
jgi:hypothetical protein